MLRSNNHCSACVVGSQESSSKKCCGLC